MLSSICRRDTVKMSSVFSFSHIYHVADLSGSGCLLWMFTGWNPSNVTCFQCSHVNYNHPVSSSWFQNLSVNQVFCELFKLTLDFGGWSNCGCLTVLTAEILNKSDQQIHYESHGNKIIITVILVIFISLTVETKWIYSCLSNSEQTNQHSIDFWQCCLWLTVKGNVELYCGGRTWKTIVWEAVRKTVCCS